MNNKGFTLVELLVTIALIALVSTITVTGVIGVLNSSKESEYKILVKNIKSAGELLYSECSYEPSTSMNTVCNAMGDGIEIGDLINYGKLIANSDGNVINPKNDIIINNCKIKIMNNNGKVNVTFINSSTPMDFTKSNNQVVSISSIEACPNA